MQHFDKTAIVSSCEALCRKGLLLLASMINMPGRELFSGVNSEIG